jgi:hypothetical protein
MMKLEKACDEPTLVGGVSRRYRIPSFLDVMQCQMPDDRNYLLQRHENLKICLEDLMMLYS